MQPQYEWLKQKLQQQSWQTDLLQVLHYDDIETLLQDIVNVRASAQNTSSYAIIQAKPRAENFALVFSPLILSLIGHPSIYYAPRASVATEVLAQYFNLDALAVSHQQAFTDMQLCFDIKDAAISVEYFELLSSIKALLNPAIAQIIVLDSTLTGLDTWLSELGCQTNFVASTHSKYDYGSAEINYKTLFWKRKTAENAAICEDMTHINSQMLNHLNLMQLNDLNRLIDDFMYSEHIFEKISVFGEFTETIYKDQLLKAKKAC